MSSGSSSDKGFVPAALLAMFFGYLGIHRFYVGKPWTGLLMLLTFGGFSIWALIDFIIILCDGFEDGDGRPIHRSDAIDHQSPKGFVPAFLLCWFLGIFGFHRFYAGKIGTGILMLVTFGGFFIWWLIDTVLLLTGGFTDGDGLII